MYLKIHDCILKGIKLTLKSCSTTAKKKEKDNLHHTMSCMTSKETAFIFSVFQRQNVSFSNFDP